MNNFTFLLPTGDYSYHPCTGKCSAFPTMKNTSESKEDVAERESKVIETLIEKLRAAIPIAVLKPLNSKMLHNCVSLPCGYPVYGCSCRDDAVIEIRWIPFLVSYQKIVRCDWRFPLIYRSYFKTKERFYPELWVSGFHTQHCLQKMGKTVEEVYETEYEATTFVDTVAEAPPVSYSPIDLTKYLDYEAPLTLKMKKGRRDKRVVNQSKRGKNKERGGKRAKKGKNKVKDHHVDVRVSDPFLVSRSDALFWDDIIGKPYVHICACGAEYSIPLRSVADAFNSNFRCPECDYLNNVGRLICESYDDYYYDYDYDYYYDYDSDYAWSYLSL